MAPGEEDSLSRLFYLVYGYDYINEFVYYPEKIKAMIEAGDLLSIVAARPNGRLVGHVGLVRRHREPAVRRAAAQFCPHQRRPGGQGNNLRRSSRLYRRG